MKLYSKPEFEVVLLPATDVITDSTTQFDNDSMDKEWSFDFSLTD